MPNTYLSTSAAFRRIAKDAARAAIRDWLRGLRHGSVYLFTVDGVKCALEYSTGHRGFEEGGHWRWGRVGVDPDENLSVEDVLLDVALGRKLSPEPSLTARPSLDLPVLSGRAELTRAEIRAQVIAHATENLAKLALRPLPRA